MSCLTRVPGLLFCFLLFLLSACASKPLAVSGEAAAAAAVTASVPQEASRAAPPRPPRVALVLGGGAARGFAHVGVIKALETQGVHPDIIVGTSAGSAVGALYAAGGDVFALQELALKMDDATFKDWGLFERGLLKGEAIERFINQQLSGRPIEKLSTRFAAVATDLSSGTPTVFVSGNTGTAVRASSAIPGVFSPVLIRGREYVDGAVSSPVPVRAARQLGADVVIAVDISGRPSGKARRGSLDVMVDSLSIMGATLGANELREADVVIRPDITGLPLANFQQRNEAILRGERAGFAAIPRIREQIAARSH